ncbi:rRNA maturation RNase YbeY [bacterium]|jgi:probable rRNA maturation factor|nr:rRNA maturation RNase YbeY [bacterium]MBT3795599.1 rRNA maturation RNase YbeY [bacterium]
MPLFINDSNIKIKSINKSILKRTLIRTMKYLNIEKRHIDITFVDNVKIKELNTKYRNIKESTDVLSFLVDGHDNALLGDVFISLDYARKNCSINHNSLSKEVKILSIHAILHLIGYNHVSKEEEKEMFKIQNELYEKFK